MMAKIDWFKVLFKVFNFIGKMMGFGIKGVANTVMMVLGVPTLVVAFPIMCFFCRDDRDMIWLREFYRAILSCKFWYGKYSGKDDLM